MTNNCTHEASELLEVGKNFNRGRPADRELSPCSAIDFGPFLFTPATYYFDLPSSSWAVLMTILYWSLNKNSDYKNADQQYIGRLKLSPDTLIFVSRNSVFL